LRSLSRGSYRTTCWPKPDTEGRSTRTVRIARVMRASVHPASPGRYLLLRLSAIRTGEEEGERVWQSGGPGFLVVPAAFLNDHLQAIFAKSGSAQKVDERLKCARGASSASFTGPDAHHNPFRPVRKRSRAIEQHAIS